MLNRLKSFLSARRFETRAGLGDAQVELLAADLRMLDEAAKACPRVRCATRPSPDSRIGSSPP